MRLTGQLPPASSWTAPGQLGANPSRFASPGTVLWALLHDKWISLAPDKSRKKSKKSSALCISSWNVCTMCPEFYLTNKPGLLVLDTTVSCRMHENWQRLLELCSMHNLCITDTLQAAPSYFTETSLVPQMAQACSSYDQTKQSSLHLQQPQRRLRY